MEQTLSEFQSISFFRLMFHFIYLDDLFGDLFYNDLFLGVFLLLVFIVFDLCVTAPLTSPHLLFYQDHIKREKLGKICRTYSPSPSSSSSPSTSLTLPFFLHGFPRYIFHQFLHFMLIPSSASLKFFSISSLPLHLSLSQSESFQLLLLLLQLVFLFITNFHFLSIYWYSILSFFYFVFCPSISSLLLLSLNC